MQSSAMSLGVAATYLTFDTATTNYLKTSTNSVTVPFTIEGFTGAKLKGSFAGSVVSLAGVRQTITNGTVSLEIGKGSRAPKFLEAIVAGAKLMGPVRSAVLKANTLIIDGFTFNGDTTYQLQVRTGGTLKTGTYKSTDGGVGFQMYRPSTVAHYVSDSLGDLAVTILSVEGSVVTGTFEGKALQIGSGGATAPVTSGKLTCRVRDYQAYADVSNQWKFSMDNFGQAPYFTAGGNIVSAAVKQSGSAYVLTLSGNTDNGRSAFYLTLRSFRPFATGIYALQSFTDSCYLSTPTAKYFNSNSNFYVRIDSLSSTRLVGGFFGTSVWGSTLYGSGFQQTLRKGVFRTEGHF